MAEQRQTESAGAEKDAAVETAVGGEPAPTQEGVADETSAETTVAVEAVELTPAEIEELKVRAAKANEHWERLLRTTADYDNYKKRAAREREEAVKYSNESIMKRLIPVLDNFDMAMSAVSQSNDAAVQNLQSGVQMIAQQLKTALQEYGLEEVEAEGKAFDPHLHEAVSEQESDVVEEGNVLQQLRKGYKLRDRLIRPATVIVAKKPSE